jgi:hypothetical protein
VWPQKSKAWLLGAIRHIIPREHPCRLVEVTLMKGRVLLEMAQQCRVPALKRLPNSYHLLFFYLVTQMVILVYYCLYSCILAAR